MNFNCSLEKMILTVFIVTSFIPDFFVSAQMRIHNGRKERIENYPYVVSIQRKIFFQSGKFEHQCGGTLISPKFVMSAAHCFNRFLSYVVKGGTDDLDDKKNGFTVPISKVFVHPDFIMKKFHENDISLALLAKPIETVKGKIEVAELPRNLQEVPLVEGTALGWGAINNKEIISRHLRAAHMSVVKNEICEELLPSELESMPINDKTFCALDQIKHRSVCNGDSGGPFEVNGKVVGITSWGPGGDLCKTFGYFTKVSKFMPFINRTEQESENQTDDSPSRTGVNFLSDAINVFSLLLQDIYTLFGQEE